jgi:hypothetical protein
MQKFNILFKKGTKVLLLGLGWQVVKTVHGSRNWVELEGIMGSFQRGHVLKFSNK